LSQMRSGTQVRKGVAGQVMVSASYARRKECWRSRMMRRRIWVLLQPVRQGHEVDGSRLHGARRTAELVILRETLAVVLLYSGVLVGMARL